VRALLQRWSHGVNYACRKQVAASATATPPAVNTSPKAKAAPKTTATTRACFKCGKAAPLVRDCKASPLEIAASVLEVEANMLRVDEARVTADVDEVKVSKCRRSFVMPVENWRVLTWR
jgi:hypothetical protein